MFFVQNAFGVSFRQYAEKFIGDFFIFDNIFNGARLRVDFDKLIQKLYAGFVLNKIFKNDVFVAYHIMEENGVELKTVEHGIELRNDTRV